MESEMLIASEYQKVKLGKLRFRFQKDLEKIKKKS
jgi:hypothetical protein